MALAKIRTHWYGMAIGEVDEDGQQVFIPAWANGCLDEQSVATTPRFATLTEAKVAVDEWFRAEAAYQAERARQAAERRAARPAPAPAVTAAPARQRLTCLRCGEFGYWGEYPFTTYGHLVRGDTAICDDCGA
jgi:hypothetical protein